MNTWMTVYKEELEKAVAKYPQDYPWYPLESVEAVCNLMRRAFYTGTYNKDGWAIKNACKRLKIPYTYKAINHFIANHD